MKNLPLAVQIWLICAGITLCVFILLAAILPWTLGGFFTDQIFGILQDSQKNLSLGYSVAVPVTAPPDIVLRKEGEGGGAAVLKVRVGPGDPVSGQNLNPWEDPPPVPGQYTTSPEAALQGFFASKTAIAFGQGVPVVRHIVFADDFKVSPGANLPDPFLRLVEEDARNQKDDVQKYSREVDSKTLFYVIRKEDIQGKPGYMVSFSWGNYRNDLVAAMFWRLLLLMIIVFLLIWPPSLWLARYLTRPLVQMEAQLARIADRDWHHPFTLDRGDEIGRLARSFEEMRRRLVRQDRAQQSFLQNVSHDLKTPVMAIRSYAQSILDGIYPKGTLEGSVEVINREAGRLEGRVRDLLHLTKMNYLASRERQVRRFDLAGVFAQGVERFSLRRPDLTWDVKMPPLVVDGDQDQWGVAVENLLDNQVRYAFSRVGISPAGPAENGSAIIRVWNDGPHIDGDLLDTLFETYRAGRGGEFGLGLSIVKQILDFHQARVWVKNEDQGVAFYIQVKATLEDCGGGPDCRPAGGQ